MKVSTELALELLAMVAREENYKKAIAHIHSATMKLGTRALDENKILAIEQDLWEAIHCLERKEI